MVKTASAAGFLLVCLANPASLVAPASGETAPPVLAPRPAEAAAMAISRSVAPEPTAISRPQRGSSSGLSITPTPATDRPDERPTAKQGTRKPRTAKAGRAPAKPRHLPLHVQAALLPHVRAGQDPLLLQPQPSEPNDVFLQLNGPVRSGQDTGWRARRPFVLGNVTIGERGSAPVLWEVNRPSDARRLTVGARPIRGGGLIALEAALDP